MTKSITLLIKLLSTIGRHLSVAVVLVFAVTCNAAVVSHTGELTQSALWDSSDLHWVQSELVIPAGVVNDTTLRFNDIGIYAYQKTSPLIERATIHGNRVGLLAVGYRDHLHRAYEPRPVITASSLYENTENNYQTSTYYSGPGVILNATGNWWGTADPVSIAATIFDYDDILDSTDIPQRFWNFRVIFSDLKKRSIVSGKAIFGEVQCIKKFVLYFR